MPVMLFLVKNSLLKKGSVRWCVVAMQQPVLLLPKLTAKSSHAFAQSPLNVTAACEIDCLAYQDELFVNNPLYVEEKDMHAFHFALHLSNLFWSRWVWAFPLGGLLLCVRLITINPTLCH
jgi:hypothetical protein